jgi:hypothetical protein
VWNLRTPGASVRFPSTFHSSSLGVPRASLHVATCLVAEGERTIIDGLKLTISGEELRTLLEDRIAEHNGAADHWRREQARTPESQTDQAPLLPDHMCEHEEERHVWRAEVLEFIRNHVDPQETYRLSAAELEFGELLPSKPGSIEQEDYEERTAVGFQLERLTKRLGEIVCRAPVSVEDWVPPGYKSTRVDVEVGSETIQIEQIEPADEAQ